MPTILLVEDNELNRDMLSRRLARRGYAVLAAQDGEEGHQMACAHMPHLILMDIGLPEMDGTELARRLKQDPLHEGLRLIAATGYGGDCDRALTTDAGFEHHIVKPLSLDELVRLIGRKDA